MNEKSAIINKEIIIKYPTRLKDIKVGDIVITAELHQVKRIEGRNYITCTQINEPYPYVKHLGWGQQGLLKVIGGVSIPKSPKAKKQA